MRRRLQALSAAAVLALVAAPATSSAEEPVLGSTVTASVELSTAGDGTIFAVATFESGLHFRLTGRADLFVNGNAIPLGPIDTDDREVLTEPVGDESAPVAACLVFEGTLHVNGDAGFPIERRDCVWTAPRALSPNDGRLSSPGRSLPVIRVPRVGQTRGDS